MNILVCGGRTFGKVKRSFGNPFLEPKATQEKLAEYKFIHATLNRIVGEKSVNYSATDNWLPTDITIITGGAPGADRAAEDFAICHFCRLKVFPAQWDEYGHAAGPIRNQQMITEGKPDLVVAFPGGKGTAHMVALAKRHGLEVVCATYP